MPLRTCSPTSSAMTPDASNNNRMYNKDFNLDNYTFEMYDVKKFSNDEAS